jgi:hypothetical protein
MILVVVVRIALDAGRKRQLLQRVTQQGGPSDVGVTGFIATALLRAEDHFRSASAAGIGRTSVCICGGRGARASVDFGPFFEASASSEKCDGHAWY